MRKTLYALLMLVLILPILAACGGTAGDGGTASAPAESSAAPASEAAESAAPTESEAPSESAEASTEASTSTEASPEASASTEAAASTAATGTAGGSGEGIRVALVTDVGKINDGTFNQFAYEGLQRAEQELGVQIDYIETQQPTDYERNLSQFADQGYDLVIGVGFLMGDAITAVASRYPDVNFAIVDSAPAEGGPANLKGMVFQEDQAAYMVGAMAALMSQSNVIGVVGGEEIPPVQKFVLGYEAGAKSQKPDILVQQVYIPSFVDPAGGSEAATSQIAEGADVIFGAGGQTGSGAIQGAAAAGVYVIGVDKDEYFSTFNNGQVQGADRLITSALKRVDNAVFAAVQSVVDGSFSNELYVGTAENGGVDFAESHDAEVPQDVIDAVNEIKQGLADGSIETGVELP